MPPATRRRLRPLTTAREVVGVLDGVKGVAALTGMQLKAVYHWVAVDCFPAKAHDAMKKALKKRGYTAPASLWAQIVAKKVA